MNILSGSFNWYNLKSITTNPGNNVTWTANSLKYFENENSEIRRARFPLNRLPVRHAFWRAGMTGFDTCLQKDWTNYLSNGICRSARRSNDNIGFIQEFNWYGEHSQIVVQSFFWSAVTACPPVCWAGVTALKCIIMDDALHIGFCLDCLQVLC